MNTFLSLEVGEPAPWFRQRSLGNPSYAFDTVAGRAVLLCFLGSLQDEHSTAALNAVLTHRSLFDDTRASFFAITNDPSDTSSGWLRDVLPGYRFILDFDGQVGKLYGAVPNTDLIAGEAVAIRRLWIVLDPQLQIRAVIPFSADRSDIAQAIAAIETVPHAGQGSASVAAPVLMAADVLESQLRNQLIERYETLGNIQSGFMRQVEGKTTLMHDDFHKKRRDHLIDDPELIRTLQARFARRLTPLIERAFQFKVTRMERYIVACYDGKEQSHFRAHRDNTTAGTAHRRFAVSVNLNDDYEGGEISFPEYGPMAYKPPPGAALVFSCSLLHAVAPMRRGKRYVFLPFLYDEAAAQLREANNVHLSAEVMPYQAQPT